MRKIKWNKIKCKQEYSCRCLRNKWAQYIRKASKMNVFAGKYKLSILLNTLENQEYIS